MFLIINEEQTTKHYLAENKNKIKNSVLLLKKFENEIKFSVGKNKINQNQNQNQWCL